MISKRALKRYIDRKINSEFTRIRHRDNLQVVQSTLDMLDRLSNYFDIITPQLTLGWATGHPISRRQFQHIYETLRKIKDPRKIYGLIQNPERMLNDLIQQITPIMHEARKYKQKYAGNSVRSFEYHQNGQLESGCLSAINCLKKLIDNGHTLASAFDQDSDRRKPSGFNQVLHSGGFSEKGRFGNLDLDSKYW